MDKIEKHDNTEMPINYVIGFQVFVDFADNKKNVAKFCYEEYNSQYCNCKHLLLMSVTFKTTEPFYHNFDLSVVIPFYRKMGGGCPKTSDSNSRILQSESLNEVLVPYSGKKAPSNGVQTTFISTDSYKLKVEKTVKGVLGRAGGGAGFPKTENM